MEESLEEGYVDNNLDKTPTINSNSNVVVILDIIRKLLAFVDRVIGNLKTNW